MHDLFLGLGLVFVIEGLVYALFPRAVEEMLALMRQMPVDTRRLLGLAAVAAGLVLVWAARNVGA